jgi:diadenosine tetraphosphate (Ap4A) HIT family hydrolase
MLSVRNKASRYIGGLSTCPYCECVPEDTWIFTEDVLALPHPAPFAAFHTIVAPRRHVAAFYDLDVAEQRHVWDVLTLVRKRIASTLPVTAFDVGFQDAGAADPDSHAVVHLIPRVSGAQPALPGNIDWVSLDS